MKSLRAVAAIALMAVCLPVMAQDNAKKNDKKDAGRAKLEAELSQLEVKWMDAERNRDFDYLKANWTDQFFDLLAGGRIRNKEEMLKLFSGSPANPNRGGFPDDMHLMAVYGNFAIMTDHTTIKGANGNTENRCIRMFVKENGKWKAAGSAIVPIVPPAGNP